MPRRFLRTAAVLLGYGALFVVLDTQATLFEIAPGVSLWYPSAGLNLALVLIFGVRYTPAIFVALLASGLWISDPAIPVQHLLLPNLAIAVGNGGVAWALRRALRGRALATPGSMVRLIGAMAALATWNSVLAPVSYLLTGLEGYALDTLHTTAFKWGVGDWAGMLTLTPPLLVAALAVGVRTVPESWTRGLNVRWPRTRGALLELGGQVGAVVLSLYGAFRLFEGPYLLYLCFLPILWMALRHGLARASVGVLIVNLGAVILLSGGSEPGSILGLQLFILALALTGLVVGALVSERRHTVDTLRHVLAGTDGGGEPVSPEGSPDASIDEEVHRVADRVHSKQQQLAADADLLQRQNRRRDQLFGIIAHDLQGAVGTAGGLAEVVEAEADTLPRDKIATFGRSLGRSIERAQTLLNGLLEWAQLYAEDDPEESAGERIEAIVEPALDHVGPDAEEKQIRIEREIESDLMVRGSPTLLQAVVRNLLSNAIKFTEESGRVVVRATGEADTVTLCVQDDGVGMSQDELDSLFKPDERTSRPGTAGEQGAGLGLVLCREIVEQYGGQIWAESTPGEGTAVYCTVPASAGENAPEPPLAEDRTESS
ncbi:MAG: ATP-binding protein [Salinibacter sp.]|uniref:sensor histidine kinase n=1 Tax=Salinibacter sp. TaxID=2065818 RepID=UPI0035D4F9E6